MSPKEAQHDMDQYKMPKALKQERTANYQIGYQATTGNQTSGEPEVGKRSDEKN